MRQLRRIELYSESDNANTVEVLFTCGLFDEGWYLSRYPDVQAVGMAPRDHFARFGFYEGRDPHPLFLSSWYLEQNEDVASIGSIPITHYIFNGGREQRSPHPFVAQSWLRRQLDPLLPYDNPLLGYLAAAPPIGTRPIFEIGLMRERLGLAPSATGPETMCAWLGLNPLKRPDPHWLVSSEFIDKTGGGGASGDPLLSYIEGQGRSSPHPLFSNDHVWAAHPFLRDGSPELTLLERAILAGRIRDIDTSPLFDREHYRKSMTCLQAARQPEIIHYLHAGASEGLDPNPYFDEATYRDRYLRNSPQVAGLAHYVTWFDQAHITLAPRFPDRFYVKRYPEVAESSYEGSPLEHYVRFGRHEGRRISDPVWTDDFVSLDELRDQIRQSASRLGHQPPEVSIIIAAYNQFRFTLRCVWSLLTALDGVDAQVIIADDGSSDETADFFGSVPGLTHIRSQTNRGFLTACNGAAKKATGPHLLLLNNDTAVLPGAVRAMLDTAKTWPDAGLVGAKLLYPDGTLQEAGGYIWKDGTGANLGRYGDPSEPGFNLRRDADYISGAAILVPRPLWERVGGFDERYVPAYCEDSDLAMRVRNLGWRVIYEPAAQVVHFEGISSGTSTESGVKAYQVVNQQKLREKWDFALETHLQPQAVSGGYVPRPPRPRILVIDAIVPEPHQDAGSVTAVWYLRLLTELGYEVTFLPENLLLNGKWGQDLRAIGVSVLHHPYVQSVETYIDRHAGDYDAILLYRVTTGGNYIRRVRQACPGTPIIFDTVDLHFLRAEREAARHGNPKEMVAAAADLRARELMAIELADQTILLSHQERQLLRDMGQRGSFSVIPLVLENKTAIPPREGRHGIAFIGGFQHTPNVDAVTYFMAELYPLLAKAASEIEVHIVGSKPPASILQIDQPNVIVHGFVEDLDGFLDKRIATIVPLRYGAGIKGKIGTSFAAGVPVISTAVGAEGMGLQSGNELLVADSPADFVAAIQRVCSDHTLWRQLSEAGRAFVDANYSPRVTRTRLLRLLAQAKVVPFAGTCPITGQREERRFLDGLSADSLGSMRGGTNSSERVLAHALSRLAGEPGKALQYLTPEELPGIEVCSDLPVLGAALERLGLARPDKTPRFAVARIVQDTAAVESLRSMLDTLPQTVSRLMIACPAAGKTPVGKRAAPVVLTTLVETLEASGWEVRCDQMPLKECAITDVPLVEARRAPPSRPNGPLKRRKARTVESGLGLDNAHAMETGMTGPFAPGRKNGTG